MTSASKLERARYVLVYYFYEGILKEEELKKIFMNQLNRLFGVRGSLEMGLFISWIHPTEPMVILRTSHKSIFDLLCTSFFITHNNSKKLSILPLRTGGSIKKMQELAQSAKWETLKELKI